MSNRLLMNSTAMSPATTDADFAFAPMQPNLGFDVAGNSHQDQHNLYDNFVDFAAGFPFQQDSSMSLLPPQTSLPLLAPPPCLAMTAMPSLSPNHQMPLPGVQNAEICHPFNCSAGSPFLMKREDGPLVDAGGGGGGGRLGLNLGRRTYFSPADVLAVDRLLMTRSSRFGVGMGMAGLLGLGLGAAHHHQPPPPRCQAEGCKADLSAAKHYHRRHKVCEYHAKAAAVADGGKQKRFCQQCSRFHVLAEFDESKRSCRKRLTEHNRRRRKSASAQGGEDSSPPPKKADTTSITTSYNSDQKSASTVAAKSTAISPNGSGVSCLDMADNNGHQTSSAAAAAAPTALSLAAPPEKDSGGLDAILMMHGSRVHRDDDEDQRCIPSLLLQAQQQQQQHNDGGHMLSCSSSMPDQHQNGGGGCNSFFEADFI